MISSAESRTSSSHVEDGGEDSSDGTVTVRLGEEEKLDDTEFGGAYDVEMTPRFEGATVASIPILGTPRPSYAKSDVDSDEGTRSNHELVPYALDWLPGQMSAAAFVMTEATFWSMSD